MVRNLQILGAYAKRWEPDESRQHTGCVSCHVGDGELDSILKQVGVG